MRMEPALLEDWLRDNYFTAIADLGSSGVAPWSFGQLREMLDLDYAALDSIVFADSQSLGDPQLREAIAHRWAGGDTARVMATHGSSESIFLAMNGLLSAGDEVVVAQPGYHALSSVAEAIGCDVRRWHLPEQDGFEPDLDDLARLITPHTRMVVVNFPHNPTGVSLDEQRMRELVDMVSRHGSYLMWDAAFAEMTYGTPQLPDPADWYERAISFGTLSKAYGLPGIRVGWCIAAPDLFPALLPLRDRLTIALSPLVEYVATRAIECADLLLWHRIRQAEENLDTLCAWADDMGDLIEVAKPTGGVSTFPRLGKTDDVDALCVSLMADEGVLLVPGSCFGHPDRIRLGFGGMSTDFDFGLAKLEAALRKGAM